MLDLEKAKTAGVYNLQVVKSLVMECLIFFNQPMDRESRQIPENLQIVTSEKPVI